MNVPEFITGPVRISERKLGAAAMKHADAVTPANNLERKVP